MLILTPLLPAITKAIMRQQGDFILIFLYRAHAVSVISTV